MLHSCCCTVLFCHTILRKGCALLNINNILSGPTTRKVSKSCIICTIKRKAYLFTVQCEYSTSKYVALIFKVSSETFHQILQPRLPEETKRTINRNNLRSKEVDKIKHRIQTGVKEQFNCLWDVIDPHRYINIMYWSKYL